MYYFGSQFIRLQKLKVCDLLFCLRDISVSIAVREKIKICSFQPWSGSSVDQSNSANQGTYKKQPNECINKWNRKSMFLPCFTLSLPPSLQSIDFKNVFKSIHLEFLETSTQRWGEVRVHFCVAQQISLSVKTYCVQNHPMCTVFPTRSYSFILARFLSF